MICVIANARHTPDSIDRFENGVARRSSRRFWIYSPEHLRFRMQIVVLALPRASRRLPSEKCAPQAFAALSVDRLFGGAAPSQYPPASL